MYECHLEFCVCRVDLYNKSVTVIDLARTKFMNSSPNDKILDWGKFKAFADYKIKSDKIMIFVFNRIENIVGKGENETMFSKGLFLRVAKC